MKVYKPNVLLPFAFGIILISVIWNTSNPYQVRNTFALAEKQLPTTTITDNDIPFSLPLVGLDNNGTVGRTTPVANAGPDQIVNEGTSVTLNGTASKDPDGVLLSYSWKQIPTSPYITLSGVDTAVWTFIAPSISSDTIFTFELTVTDNKGAIDTDIVNVVVKDTTPNISTPYITSHTNNQPVANAGPDQIVNEGTSVTLNGTASKDPDGNITSYSWRQIVGNSIELSEENTATTTFVAPHVLKNNTLLTFELKVTDNDNASDINTVNIMIKVVEHPIIANAGQDQEVSEGKEVTLDGSSSYSNGTITSYSWKQIDGKPVKLKDAHAAELTFKAPKVHKDSTLKFRLTVNNDEGKSNTDIVKVVVKK